MSTGKETRSEKVELDHFSLIGNRFVYQFYNKLHDNPSELYYYFKEDSTFVHGNETDSTLETVRGQQNIKEKIKNLEYENAQVILSVVDCQASADGGILILVMGFLSNKNQEFKKFVETFYLASNKDSSSSSQSSFYLLNDIFRYVNPLSLDLSSFPSEKEQEAKSNPESVSSTSSSVVVNSQDEKSAELISSPPVPSPLVVEKERETTEKESVVTQPISSPPPSNGGSVLPPSFSSVSSQASVSSSTPSTQTSSTKSTGGTTKQSSSWASVVTKVTPDSDDSSSSSLPSAASSKPQQQQVPTGNSQQTQIKIPPKSLYVSNIPFECNESDISEMFVRFGQIKQIDHRAQNGYCFVEFVDGNNVLQAMNFAKENPILLKGRSLVVNERKPKADGQRKDKKEGKDGQTKKTNGTNIKNVNLNNNNNNNTSNNRDNFQAKKPAAPKTPTVNSNSSSSSLPQKQKDGKVNASKTSSKATN